MDSSLHACGREHFGTNITITIITIIIIISSRARQHLQHRAQDIFLACLTPHEAGFLTFAPTQQGVSL
jgi:hypothetical protein